jgi:cysteinyl-tRNA synthetase
VLAKGKKMSYAEDICVVLPDLLAMGYSPREIRFFMLQSHYRQPVHLNDERLEAACTALRRLDDCIANLVAVRSTGPREPELESWVHTMKEEIREAMFDDMNISAALAALFRLVRQSNYLLAQGRLHSDDAHDVEAALRAADKVFGILPPPADVRELPSEIDKLVRKRDEARESKDYALADTLRDQLVSHGYIVEDGAGGTRIKPKNAK